MFSLNTINNLLFNSRYAKSLAWLSAGIMVILIIVSAIDKGQSIWNLSKPVTVSPQQLPTIQASQLPDIASMSLFGSYQTSAPPKTTLQLKLLGVFQSTNGQGSQAVIAPVGSEEGNSYTVGDTLPGGAVIYKIEPEKVLLRHNGRIEMLPLEDDKLKFGPPPGGINTNQ